MRVADWREVALWLRNRANQESGHGFLSLVDAANAADAQADTAERAIAKLASAKTVCGKCGEDHVPWCYEECGPDCPSEPHGTMHGKPPRIGNNGGH